MYQESKYVIVTKGSEKKIWLHTYEGTLRKHIMDA